MSTPSDPATPSPTPRRRTPRWAVLSLIIGGLLMATSATALVGSRVLIDRYTGEIQQQDLLAGAAKIPEDPGKSLDGPVTMLLLGVDERGSRPGDMRSDTIIILHIPASHDQAYLVSVPRDTWVEVPAFEPSGYAGGESKLTDAFHAGSQNGAGRAGGAQLVALTLKEVTGIEFDGAAIIDFDGFRDVIDALGGVQMCVDQRVMSQHMRLVDGEPMWLAEAREVGGGEELWHEEGCKRMAGWEALDYSRQRYGLPNGDYDRQRHQRQLVKAMVQEASSTGVLTNPARIDDVITAAGRAFVLDTGGVPIVDFVFTLRGITANDLVLVTTNDGEFNSAGFSNTAAERLTPQSLEMFDAVRTGTLDEYLLANPDAVQQD
ncbi:LCP family protein [Micromonospora sp. NBC_01813]|uniref:LCP family protein n=1 Tax=Micromonospora sp. NBC_01813 TaxID=2975988 RepID=UPI002DD8A706|nr:LCP family protein [Micromonospora sp. NBC_01813]WSA08586.1 LCP family protein [Micromonospora sp. NBC_01813]